MAVNYPNMLDVARRLDANGKIAMIVEMLAQQNEILDDMLMIEGNLPVGHKTTVRKGLPTATWRKLNYGVARSKSQTAQITDFCGMLESYAEVDKKLADLNGNSAEWRLSEDKAFIEAMNQEMARTIFYGNLSKPEEFVGFTPRYNDAAADSAENIIDGGGTGTDNTSMWLVVWDQLTCHGIFPKGSKAGITQEDKGNVTLFDENGNPYEGYRTHYQWDIGLTVRDWRYAVRVANIDVSSLDTTSAADLIDLLISAVHKLPNRKMGRPAIYANSTILTALDKQTRKATNNTLNYSNVYGQEVLNFRGIPFRQVDQLLNTEAAVTGL